MTTLQLLLYALPVAGIVAAAFTPPGQAALAFIAGTRLGRWLAGVALLAYGALVAWNIAVSRGRRQGAAGAMRQVDEANAAAKADRDRTEAKAANEDDDALRRELRRYSPVILAVIALGMGGCATVPTGGAGRGGAFCDVERPIALNEAAIVAMDHDELARAVAHNRHGERQCGWKPAATRS